MNILPGTITSVETYEGISLVKIDTINKIVCTSVVIDSPETADYLQIGKTVNILFKETEVIIAEENLSNISIQNKFPCIIKSIKTGVILCQINLIIGENMIHSVITSNACKQLKLTEDKKVIALIKSTEVSLSPNDRH